MSESQALIINDSDTSSAPVLMNIPVPVVLSQHPKTLGIVDTVLLVIDNYQTPYISLYALSDLHLLTSFGRRGDRIGQFMNPNFYNQYAVENGKVKFFIADLKKNSIEKYDLDNILRDTTTLPEQFIRLRPSLINRASSLFVLKDSLIVGNLFANAKGLEGRYFIFNMQSKQIEGTGFFPELPDSIKQKPSPYYYYSHSAIDLGQTMIASAMHRFKRVDFIRFNNGKAQTRPSVFKGYEHVFPGAIADINPEPGSTLFYNSCFGGKKYFYAMCLNTNEQQYASDSGHMELHAFSWSGELKKKWRLDRLFLGQFCVDEQRGKLYVVNFGRDKSVKPILLYPIPDN